MKIVAQTKVRPAPLAYPVVRGKQRLAVWESVRGMWKTKKPDPRRELRNSRREWERKLPR